MSEQKPNGGITRRESTRLRRRKEIIDVARTLFAENGLQATSMEQIALKADVSKGTLYLYFGSKDDLYVSAILEDFWTIEKRMLEILSADDDLFTKGRAMYLTFVDHCMRNTDYVRVAQYFLTDDARRNITPELVDAVMEQTERLLGHLAGMVRSGIDAGLIREDVDPVAFSVLAWRMTVGLLELAFAGDIERLGIGDYRGVFEPAFEILVSGIRRQV